MSSSPRKRRCEQTDLVAPYALAALDPSQAKLMEAHLSTCAECQQELQTLGPVANTLTAWRTQTLPPPAPLWNRLAERIAGQKQKEGVASAAPASSQTQESQTQGSQTHGWPDSHWREVAPGITCKLLSTDVDMDRVSMLVRLSRGTSYPPHQHASVEELYLLEGELWIDDRKLCPGDYSRAEPGSSDQRVWSPTGCLCLLITSPSDQLR